MQLEYELNTMFEDSIKKRDFQIYLQPKVRLADLTLSGAEALVRWIHPDKGMICPSDLYRCLKRTVKFADWICMYTRQSALIFISG